MSRYVLSDDVVFPVLWQDNYFSLLLRESRHLTATYQSQDLGRRSLLMKCRAQTSQRN